MLLAGRSGRSRYRKEVHHARDHYPPVPGLQEPELLDDEEQEDHDRPSRVQEVLQHVPEAHAAQRDQVAGIRG
jgi:hypothetical protein